MLNLKLANLGTAHILLVGGSTKSISVYPHGMGKKQPTYLSSSIVEKIDLYLFTKRWKKKKLLLKIYLTQRNILLRIVLICTMTKMLFFTSSFACIWWWALPHNFVCDDTFHRFPQRLKIHDNKTLFFLPISLLLENKFWAIKSLHTISIYTYNSAWEKYILNLM